MRRTGGRCRTLARGGLAGFLGRRGGRGDRRVGRAGTAYACLTDGAFSVARSGVARKPIKHKKAPAEARAFRLLLRVDDTPSVAGPMHLIVRAAIAVDNRVAQRVISPARAMK